MFPLKQEIRDQTGGRETTSQNGRLPFKTGGLEHMLDTNEIEHISQNYQSNELAERMSSR